MAALPVGLADALKDRYRFDRELGEGGMATVYLAHDLRHHRPVAIKVLHPQLAAVLGAERFLKEIETTASLQHPHIVALFDSGAVQVQRQKSKAEAAKGAASAFDFRPSTMLFYVMPYVEGESLRDRLRREKQLPVPDAIRIASELCSALEYAHRRGVIHRDIKPGNILLQDNQALLADFGIALGRGDERTRLTESGFTLGTPTYMSPEQASGERDVDGRTDVYSLGCVLYEMLAGEPPFTGPTPEAVIAKRLHTPPTSLRVVRSTITTWLDRAVQKALATVPGDRFLSAADFGRALELAGSEPGGVEPLSGTGPHSGRRRRVVMLAVMAVAVAAGVVLGRSQLRSHRTPGTDQPGSGLGASGRRSLAVLPFTSPDGDSANAYFGAGMAEELTTEFARVPGVRVASRGSANRFEQAGLGEAALARQLGVETILEGTVRRSGSRLRVTARLVDPKGSVLWAEQYDRKMAEIFDVQDDITRAILTALRPTFGISAHLTSTLVPGRTADLDAYDLYLKGRYYWSQRGETGLRRAIGFFEQAIARDSTFGRAWAGLSMAQVVLPVFSNLPADSLLTLASANAQRALRLDSTLADAHLAWAYALKDQWRWKESEEQFRQALALAPEDATIHHWYGVLLHVTGRIDEALAQLRLALRLDPLASQIGTDEYYVLYLARRYDEALTEGRRVWAMDTTKADGSLQIGLIQLARQRPDSALRAFQIAERLGIGFDMPAFLALAFQRLGRTREADSVYQALLERYRTDRSLAYAVAIAATGTGHFEEAMRAVRETVDRRSLFVTEFNLPCEPVFDPLKRSPRFAETLGRVGMRICSP